MTSPKRQPKIMKTVSKTIKNSDSAFPLEKKLAISELKIKNYVRKLEAEIYKLVEQNGKLQAENTILKSRIKALLKQIEEKGPSHFDILAKAEEAEMKRRKPK